MSEARRRQDVRLPDHLLAELRNLGRPERTNAGRTLGAQFFVSVYVRAVHETLGSRLNTQGLGREDEDECVERVKAALRDTFAPVPEATERSGCVGCRPQEGLFHRACPLHGVQQHGASKK